MIDIFAFGALPSVTITAATNSGERFNVQPDEQVIIKGELVYIKSKWVVVSCQGILTNKRLALGKNLNPVWGFIPRLYSYFRGKKIVFQILLQNLEAITHQDKSELFTLKTTDGSEYSVMSTSLFGKKKNDWLQAITAAGQNAQPDRRAVVNVDSVEFRAT